MNNAVVRFPAEWEEQSFIQFTFPHVNSDWEYMYEEVKVCFVNIIEVTAGFEPVVVVCQDKKLVSEYFKVKTSFPIYLVEIDSNDTWARDHGAITVFHDNVPVLLDFVFNGWGQKFGAEKDNDITLQLSNELLKDTKVKSLDFVLEGGSIETDGQGTLLTTTECLLSKYRNPNKSKRQINNTLKKEFGVSNVLWLDHGYLDGDDTDSHVDTLARLCPGNTIAYVKCEDEGDEHYAALLDMEEQLKSFKNANGEKFNLVALPWPDACFDEDGQRLPATYANFLIVNGGVMVPTYGLPQDEEAVRILSSLFTERKVVGVNCRPLIEEHGSLHCISMQYPKGVEIVD